MQLVITTFTSWKWQSSQFLLQSKHPIFSSIQTANSNTPFTPKKKAIQIATQNRKNGTKQTTFPQILQQYLQSQSGKRQGRASKGTCWWAWDRTHWGRGEPGRPRRLPRPAEARAWLRQILPRRRPPVLIDERLRLSPAIPIAAAWRRRSGSSPTRAKHGREGHYEFVFLPPTKTDHIW